MPNLGYKALVLGVGLQDQELLAHELHMPRDVVQAAGQVSTKLDLWRYTIDGLGEARDLNAQVLDDAVGRHLFLHDAYEASLRRSHFDVVPLFSSHPGIKR